MLHCSVLATSGCASGGSNSGADTGADSDTDTDVVDGEPEAVLGATFTCPWDQSDPTLHTFIVAGQSGMVAQYGEPGTLSAEYETGIDKLQMWEEGSWKRLGLSLANGNVVPRDSCVPRTSPITR